TRSRRCCCSSSSIRSSTCSRASRASARFSGTQNAPRRNRPGSAPGSAKGALAIHAPHLFAERQYRMPLLTPRGIDLHAGMAFDLPDGVLDAALLGEAALENAQ